MRWGISIPTKARGQMRRRWHSFWRILWTFYKRRGYRVSRSGMRTGQGILRNSGPGILREQKSSTRAAIMVGWELSKYVFPEWIEWFNQIIWAIQPIRLSLSQTQRNINGISFFPVKTAMVNMKVMRMKSQKLMVKCLVSIYWPVLNEFLCKEKL